MRTTLIAIAIPVCIAGHAQTSGREWKNWKGDDCRIAYPADWTERSGQDVGSMVLFLAPLTDTSDRFSENVNVMVQELNGLTLEDHVRITEEQVSTMLVNGKMITSKALDGNSHSFEYTGEIEGTALHWNAAVHIHNGKAYLITYTAESSAYDEYLYLAEAMMQSFAIGK